MNYRHIYHAGNFADVFKHAVLALCLDYLRLKEAPFRVIDTHAGTGRYDLASVEAGKTLEWIEGIGRLAGLDAPPLPDEIAPLLAPYLDIVRALNADGRLSSYPGSPLIAQAMLRKQDRLTAVELHPDDNAALVRLFAGERRVKVEAGDGWTALKGRLPPKERRGLILVDPPFEERTDFERLVQAVREIKKRFATGVALLWHPVKDEESAAAFRKAAAEAAPPGKTLHAELFVRAPSAEGPLAGCGLFIINPPWTLREKLASLGPFLAERLAQGEGANFALA
ncbi:MAG: 23S rRNA (adenine(2030)-N(6))-methyltransferase RlmJ [Alphaproteobacteria bacterium]|nr:23S rRNA (adenine(2030)-N(6))-methyltransferase RlmJ [Alphaproteobacteria bacterium]